MSSLQKCPKCGLDLAGMTAQSCPICGTSFVESRVRGSSLGSGRGARICFGALLQFAIASIFMLAFGFPKFMIAFFGAFILIAAVLSIWMKSRPVPASRTPQPPVAHPVLFRILSLAVGVCAVVCFSFLLFGFVIFANSWSNWQRYKDQSYHRADFQVTRVYYQRHGKGTDVYASGKVDGQREWMSLSPYLQAVVRGQGELEERVPVGTSIPIYLFPEMKGRSRVRVYSEVPTAEAYYRAAINALRWGLGGLAISGGILFVLLRLRAMCFEKRESAFGATV
jgi:hypothetical protein